MNKTILITLTTLIFFPTKGEEINQIPLNFIPAIEDLKQKLEKLYQKELKTEKQFLLVNKPSILDLFSGVNLNYKRNIFNSYRRYNPDISNNYHELNLSIGINLLNVFTLIKANKNFELNIKKIELKKKNQHLQHLETLVVMIEDLKNKVFIFNKTCKIHELKEKLFQIEKTKYENGEISPTEFLKKQIVFEFDSTRLQETRNELFLLKNKILLKFDNIQ